MKTSLAITGVGLVTPVGLDATVTYHSIRSGITRLSVQPWADKTNAWIVGGRVMTWTPEIREHRLRALAEMALREAWQHATGGQAPRALQPAVMFLSRPDAGRPGYSFPPDQLDYATWASGLGITAVASGDHVDGGACGSHMALERAASLLERGAAQACIIGGVDTQLQLRVLRWHENNNRLKCSYMNDGFLPGEAASFFVVETEKKARERGAHILARIASIANDTETATVLSDEPNQARALTRVCRSAIADAGVAASDLYAAWSDLNGESHRAREWAFTEVRLQLDQATELIHPADCYGDLGAASDATLLALAAIAQATGWMRAKPVIVFAGSEGGRRGASVLLPDDTTSGTHRHVLDDEPVALALDARFGPLGPDDESWEQSSNPARTYFEWMLRQEHLEEIASLYYQRQGILTNEAVGWGRLRDPERRMLAHLEAAACGGPESAWAVASGIRSDDEGIAFAGAMLLALMGSQSAIARIEEALASGTPTNLRGVEIALGHAPTVDLAASIERWLDAGGVRQLLAIAVSGYRREGDPVRFLPLIEERDRSVVRAAAVACRRFHYKRAIPFLEQLRDTDDPTLAEEVMLGLLCLGAPAGLDHCRRTAGRRGPGSDAAAFHLALCGQLDDLDILLGSGSASFTSRRLEAIGILGHVRAVPSLIRSLGDLPDDLRPAAADALERITGAGLWEQVSVSADGEDGEQASSEPATIVRVATAPDVWSTWWRSNGNRFDPATRWRKGHAFSTDLLLAELRDPQSRAYDRRRAHSELKILSQHDIAFEPDWFAARQERALGQWQSWLQKRNASGSRG